MNTELYSPTTKLINQSLVSLQSQLFIDISEEDSAPVRQDMTETKSRKNFEGKSLSYLTIALPMPLAPPVTRKFLFIFN